MNDKLDFLLNKANNLPLLPGVYIMRDVKGDIIYIGKAKVLKNRVTQYFRGDKNHTEKVRKMVCRVKDFDYIICDSEFEALMLECSLIKQNLPKYNVLLKDDKGYHYIHVSQEEWPRITEKKTLLKDGINIGPYNTGFYVKQAIDEAKKIYKLPLCSRRLTGKKSSVRPCLNHYIGLCSAPCAGKISNEEYRTCVDEAVNFLKKGSQETIRLLKEQMEQCSQQLEFERAAKLRDRITAIEKLGDKQKVVRSGVENQDVIAFVEGKRCACFEVFKFRGQQLCDREHYFVEAAGDERHIRAEFIVQYYSIKEIPPRILTDGVVDTAEDIEEYLSKERGKTVKLVRAYRGEQKQLVDMCRTNAAQRVAQREGMNVRETEVLDELRTLLGLKSVPRKIEAYDISHNAGADNVAGMVVFEDAKPNKSLYRKFAIKSVEGQDDYASMHEVVSRRLKEYEQHKGEEGFGILPDLILLDGGAGQLSAVMSLLDKYDMRSRVFGMVKDNRHNTRALVGESGQIAIKPTKSVFVLISNIQNEVHRFAIDYHRKKSAKRTLELQLTQIEGIGKKRAERLLAHFGSVNAVAAATVQQLETVRGMSATAAQSVYDYFNNR